MQIIDALKSEYSFYTLCRLLNLSKSTYINRQKSALIEKQLDVEDTLLKEKITIIFQKSDYRFGAKKIRAKLMEQGYTVSTKRPESLFIKKKSPASFPFGLPAGDFQLCGFNAGVPSVHRPQSLKQTPQ